MTARDDAIATVKRKAETGLYPTLTDLEVGEIVDDNLRAAVWAPNTAYPYGAKVMPTIYQGRIFIGQTAGTSGPTEPDWSQMLSNQPSWANFTGGLGGGDLFWGVGGGNTLGDGTVGWAEYATGGAGPYDVDQAVYDAWMKKAGKVAGKFDFSADGQSFQRSQAYDHCLRQAREWVSIGIA